MQTGHEIELPTAPSPPIRLWGVRTHNLAGVDVELPAGRMTVITGPSGSGKTSLALDTLFAEGQRRYLEVFSAYTRQFLPSFDRPPIDRIENVPPALAVRASSSAHVTGIVAEAAGVLEYLRLAFVHASTRKCIDCGQAVEASSPESIVDELLREFPDRPARISFAIEPSEVESLVDLQQRLRESGYLRIVSAGEVLRTDAEAWSESQVQWNDLRVLVDRFRLTAESRSRAMESIASALQHGHGSVVVETETERLAFHDHPRCRGCGRVYAPAEYADFVLTNLESSCPVCGRASAESSESEHTTDEHASSSPRKPRSTARPKSTRREMHSRSPCSACRGTGIRADILAHEVAGRSFPQWLSLTVRVARDQTRAILRDHAPLPSPAMLIFREIERRLDFLDEVGVGYLQLDRPSRSLSTGEVRRVTLSSALATGLSRSLFVLDEPTAGLHPRDTQRLIQAMVRLRDADNTLVVVEHDLDVIKAADHAIELGPGAGREGGRVIFAGSPVSLMQDSSTMTGSCFSRAPRTRPLREPRGWMTLRGASANNLKNINIEFPLGVVCGVAGVSGAGKTSLVLDSLVPALSQRLDKSKEESTSTGELVGGAEIGEVIVVDDASLGRTSRGNPATYLKIFDDVREKLALTLEAKILGKSAADFSFNKPGGRCETCEGLGERIVDMQFLPPAHMTCPDCGGKRYQPALLEIKYRGRNVAEILSLSADEALSFFRGENRIQQRLSMMKEVGLGYLSLGQPLSTLSRGEAQRLRLASRLLMKSAARTLFVFEEPTLGLHEVDVPRLTEAFHGLANLGHTVLVIEHHLGMLAEVDYLIELGPGAGEEGGQIIFTGTPAELRAGHTPTAEASRRRWKRNSSR